MADSKPLILTDDITLVGHDLSNVLKYLKLEELELESYPNVQFKKKENIATLAKSVLKHRIQAQWAQITKKFHLRNFILPHGSLQKF